MTETQYPGDTPTESLSFGWKTGGSDRANNSSNSMGDNLREILPDAAG